MAATNTKKVPVPSLSKAEWEVMKVLWEHGEMAARDVFAGLPADHGWAYKTVKTLLARLVAKGALDYVQVGNSYLYRPAHPREALMKEEVKDFVDRVFDGSASPALTHFIRDARLSNQDIDGLRRLLEEKARDARGGKQKGGRR